MNSDLLNDFDIPRWQGSQRRIGLTGGIASGKSSVAHFLEQRFGLPVLDADVYSRQALGPGTPLTNAVFDRYGEGVIDTSKFNSLTLDRFALARLIFSDVAERLWLEGMVHPFVRKCFDSELSKISHSFAIRKDHKGDIENSKPNHTPIVVDDGQYMQL